MDRKYLQSKSGSLEDLATQIASKQSETKVEQKVKLESPKTYLGLKENSVTAVAAKVVAEGFIKEEKFKADYTIEKRAPRNVSDEEDESESYGSITVSAKDAGEAKRKIEDEIDKRVDKMKKNPNLKGYSFEGYIDGSVQQVSEGLDPVNKVSVKKDFKNRKDKDIDNDGDVDSTDKYLHTRRQAISKATKSETHTFTAQPINKKRREAPGEKQVINPIKQKIKETISKIMGEGKMKDIATDKSELERLKTRLSQLQDKKAADTGDTSKIEREILQTQRSIKDVQLRLKDVPKEVKEGIDEKVGDDAKRLGLTDYKFGRYGKDGKITHTSKDGKLVSLPKKDQKSVSQAPKATQTADKPKKSAPSAQPKTVKANPIQISKQADKAVNKMLDTTYSKDNLSKLGKDLSSTMALIKSMSDADKTQGSAGDGFESSKKGFKSEVIDTFENLDTLQSELEDVKDEIEDEEAKNILDTMIDDIYFISDENADHDGYTKDGKVRSAIDDLVANSKKLEKRLGSVKEAVDEPYAVGMAQAMKSTGDKPPLKKSTITKAHDIAKGIMKKEQDEKKTKTEKKTYSNLRAEVENGKKTMTGQKPAVIDTEPKTKHI